MINKLIIFINIIGGLPGSVNEFGKNLDSSSGISNFLLWQIAYAELYFSEVLWPDFNKEHFEEAINSAPEIYGWEYKKFRKLRPDNFNIY